MVINSSSMKNSPPIYAVLWDYDNTLFATAQAHWSKHEVVLAKHGIILGSEHKQRVYDNNGNQNWQWLYEELNLRVSKDQYIKEIDDEFKKHISRIELRSGVLGLLKKIKDCQIIQAIVTNGRKSSVESVLKANGIDHFMKFILYKEDYEGRKPEPAPYLTALGRLEELMQKPLESKKCIAIEDDPNGVESAHKAGLTVIHRKLFQKAPDSAYADYSCYSEADFAAVVHHLIQNQ
jgi:HAD superfamily hydrolase (TIGR01509 family)